MMHPQNRAVAIGYRTWVCVRKSTAPWHKRGNSGTFLRTLYECTGVRLGRYGILRIIRRIEGRQRAKERRELALQLLYVQSTKWYPAVPLYRVSWRKVIMKRFLVFTALLAIACIGFAGIAKADSCPVGSTNCTEGGGVTWTFTSGGSDGSGGFLVDLTIGTTGSLSGTLDVFAIQFGQTSIVSIVSTDTGWTTIKKGNALTCDSNPNANGWCVQPGSGSAISVPAGTFHFEFDVTGIADAPTSTHIQAFQGQGDLAVSNPVGIGTPPTTTPEPASMLLLGLGLAGVPFLRRKRS